MPMSRLTFGTLAESRIRRSHEGGSFGGQSAHMEPEPVRQAYRASLAAGIAQRGFGRYIQRARKQMAYGASLISSDAADGKCVHVVACPDAHLSLGTLQVFNFLSVDYVPAASFVPGMAATWAAGDSVCFIGHSGCGLLDAALSGALDIGQIPGRIRNERKANLSQAWIAHQARAAESADFTAHGALIGAEGPVQVPGTRGIRLEGISELCIGSNNRAVAVVWARRGRDSRAILDARPGVFFAAQFHVLGTGPSARAALPEWSTAAVEFAAGRNGTAGSIEPLSRTNLHLVHDPDRQIALMAAQAIRRTLGQSATIVPLHENFEASPPKLERLSF